MPTSAISAPPHLLQRPPDHRLLAYDSGGRGAVRQQRRRQVVRLPAQLLRQLARQGRAVEFLERVRQAAGCLYHIDTDMKVEADGADDLVSRASEADRHRIVIDQRAFQIAGGQLRDLPPQQGRVGRARLQHQRAIQLKLLDQPRFKTERALYRPVDQDARDLCFARFFEQAVNFDARQVQRGRNLVLRQLLLIIHRGHPGQQFVMRGIQHDQTPARARWLMTATPCSVRG